MSNVLAQKAAYAAVRLHLHSGQLPFPYHEHLDHRSELEAAHAMARAYRESADKIRLIAFGPPGNGKRAFIQVLCNEMASLDGYNVIWVDTRDLVLRQDEFISYELDALDTLLSSASLRPLALAVDDADCLVSSDTKDLARSRRHEVDERLEKGAYEANPALLAIAESPMNAIQEMAPLDDTKFSYLYFGWPDLDKMCEVLGDAQIPNPMEVAQNLKQLEQDRKVRFTLSSLVNAALESRHFKDGVNRFGDMKAQDIAAELSHFCTPTPDAKVREYEKQNESFIDKALDFLREWSSHR